MREAHGQSFLVRHWKALLNIVVVLALLGLAFAVRGDVARTFTSLTQVNAYFLLLLVPIEFLNYDAQARLYRQTYAVLGDKLSYFFSFKLALELNFINNVFPSGGASGLAYFTAKMRGHGQSASRAFLVQIMKLMLTFLSFLLLLAAGLVILAANGQASELVILFASVLTTAILAGTAVFIYIITSRSRIKAFSLILVRLLGWLARKSRIKRFEAIKIENLHSHMDELHDNYKQLEKRWTALAPPFWQAFFMNVWEVLSVFVVFLAFGNTVNVGAIILAYAVANLAGLISVLPAGAGVFEALMTAVLVIAGVPAGISLSAVIMSRVLNTIIQMPPGYYFYQRTITGVPSGRRA